MVKPKKTEIERIQEGIGKDIAKLFFYTYRTPSQVTKIKYKDAWKMRNEKSQKSFVMPIVQNYLAEWKKRGFIETSKVKIPIKIERKKGKPYDLFSEGYLLNLGPLYDYCKGRGILFTEEEKSFLRLNFLSEDIREAILREFPNEDIINAMLKYYSKNLIMRYFYILRDIDENPKKYRKEKVKAEKLNNPKDDLGKEMRKAHGRIITKLKRRYGAKSDKIIKDFSTLRFFAHNLPTTPTNLLFRIYIDHLGEKDDFIPNLDRKFLTALQISPNIEKLKDEIRKKNAPRKLVKTVERPNRAYYLFDYFGRCDLSNTIYKSLLNKISLKIA